MQIPSKRRPASTCLGMSALAFLSTTLMLASCTERATPATPTPRNTAPQATHLTHAATASTAHTMAADMGDKGLLDGWFNGETVHLYYTKTFFCAEPPDSG